MTALSAADQQALAPFVQSEAQWRRLQDYAALLGRWQAKMNLVSPASLPHLWRRHMLDSAQLIQNVPRGTSRIIDLGSGAGFPGLVLAALGGWQVHLVESSQRKCAFLREAARVMGCANVTLHPTRIEAMPRDLKPDLITARALADLPQLCGYMAHLAEDRPDCQALFLKGAEVEKELTATRKLWQIQYQRHQSLSDATGCILHLLQKPEYKQEVKL